MDDRKKTRSRKDRCTPNVKKKKEKKKIREFLFEDRNKKS